MSESFSSEFEQLLAARVSERSSLVERVKSMLSADDRVVAAWLTGSLARGDFDALSDVDLYVAVADEHAGEVSSMRQKFVEDLTRPTLILENLRNAPPNGAYLLVHYPGVTGPQHFDWFWQPRSLAKLPDDAKLLFDRAGLETVDGETWRAELHQTTDRPEIADTDYRSIVSHKQRFYLAMMVVAAKYVARRDAGTAHRMTELLIRTLEQLARESETRMLDEFSRLRARAETPSDQLEVLRRVDATAGEMRGKTEREGIVVARDAVLQVDQFLSLVNRMVNTEDKWA